MRTESRSKEIETDPQAVPLVVRQGKFPAGDRVLPGRLPDRLPYPRVAWVDASTGEKWIGIGSADRVVARKGDGALACVEVCRSNLERFASARDGIAPRYFGGIAFDPHDPGHPAWPNAPAAWFVLPTLMMRQVSARGALEWISIAPDGEDGWIDSLVGSLPAAGAGQETEIGPCRLDAIEDPRAPASWRHSVERALRAIDRGEVRKVVLARDLLFEADRALEPFSRLRAIAERISHGVCFCYLFEPGMAFLGISPERLLAVQGDHFACDCIAGTAPRGADPGEDARLGEALLAGEKELREHRLVCEAIVDALRPVAISLDLPDRPALLRLPGLQHLSSPIQGRLRRDASLSELLARLHPTPAVGGAPRDAALPLIRELEGRSRGWYAGPVGWISAIGADFSVAIRSGIVRNRHLWATGGAGIVDGSDPASEWDETARKAASFLDLLGRTEAA